VFKQEVLSDVEELLNQRDAKRAAQERVQQLNDTASKNMADVFNEAGIPKQGWAHISSAILPILLDKNSEFYNSGGPLDKANVTKALNLVRASLGVPAVSAADVPSPFTANVPADPANPPGAKKASPAPASAKPGSILTTSDEARALFRQQGASLGKTGKDLDDFIQKSAANSLRIRTSRKTARADE
jgi:hypothetical protein